MLKRLQRMVLLFGAVVALTGCGPKKLTWTEEVKLQSGEVFNTRRQALAQPFGQIGGPGGWENEGMTVEIISPRKPDYPGTWNAKFVPLVFDRDPDTNEWFIVATFYSCTSWYDLGRPSCLTPSFDLKTACGCSNPCQRNSLGERATC